MNKKANFKEILIDVFVLLLLSPMGLCLFHFIKIIIKLEGLMKRARGCPFFSKFRKIVLPNNF